MKFLTLVENRVCSWIELSLFLKFEGEPIQEKPCERDLHSLGLEGGLRKICIV